MKTSLPALLCFALPILAGGIGSVASVSAPPPGWVFGPVWTALYLWSWLFFALRSGAGAFASALNYDLWRRNAM